MLDCPTEQGQHGGMLLGGRTQPRACGGRPIRPTTPPADSRPSDESRSECDGVSQGRPRRLDQTYLAVAGLESAKPWS